MVIESINDSRGKKIVNFNRMSFRNYYRFIIFLFCTVASSNVFGTVTFITHGWNGSMDWVNDLGNTVVGKIKGSTSSYELKYGISFTCENEIFFGGIYYD